VKLEEKNINYAVIQKGITMLIGLHDAERDYNKTKSFPNLMSSVSTAPCGLRERRKRNENIKI